MTNIKRKLALLICLALVLVMIFVLSACGGSELPPTDGPGTGTTPGHVHVEELIPAVAPTCTASGLTEGKRCTTCDEILVQQQVVGATGHTEEIIKGVAPTCTEAGLTEGKRCSVCKEILLSQFEIGKTPHTYDNETDESCNACDFIRDLSCKHTSVTTIPSVPPTCTTTGLTEGKQCSACDEILVQQQVIDATGHTEEIIKGVAPTCTETGLTEGKKCSACGEILLPQEKISATGHTIVDVYCSVCKVNMASKGLEYELSEDESYYTVVGIGTCTDTDLYIAGTYESKPVKKIAQSAFNYQKRIRTVVIGNGIEEIGSSAFFGCERLTDVVIGNDVKELAGFEYCEGLARMTVGSGVTRITGSFSQSYKLVEIYNLSSIIINLPRVRNVYTPTSGEKKTFETEDGYIFFVDGESRYLVAYKGLEKELYLPESCNGEAYEIYTFAFNDQDEITKVVIPDKVTKLPQRAIAFCDLLVEIVIGDGVTEISADSLTCNEKLTFLTIGKNVTSIDGSNLNQNERLIEIFNKSSLEITSSTALNVYTPTEGSKKTFITEDKYIFYEDNDIRYLIGYTGELVDLILPESCNGSSYEIYKYAFYNRTSANGHQATYRVRSVVIPDSVTKIGEYAFMNSVSLIRVEISNSVTSIGSSAFSGCTILTIYCEAESKPSGWASDMGTSRIVFGCKNYGKTEQGFIWVELNSTGEISVIGYTGEDTEPVIPSAINGISVTSIETLAFNSCTSLTSITIPTSVTSIGIDAFSGCTSLTSVTIPTSVTSIGSWAFEGCNKLTIYTALTSRPSGWASNMGANRIVFDCKNYGKTEQGFIWAELNSTGEMSIVAYAGEDTELVIPSTINGIGVTSIGSYAFYGCTGPESVTIPTSVTSIGSSAFEDCTGLESVTIPTSVTSIRFSSFRNCTSLTSITIPDSVTSIETLAFNGCTSLTSITIPTSVTSIGIDAFSGCTSLTSVTIPTSVTSIASYAFRNCTSLTSITIPDSVTSIGGSAFSGCTALTSITIPTSVTSIGGSAFSGCTALTSITIPTSVTSIGSYAFSGCSSLTSITIPTSVTSIASYAFRNCTSLTSITIPDSVTSIGSYAFNGCTGLESVTIPDSVTSIENWAFSGCNDLIIYTTLTSRPSGWASNMGTSRIVFDCKNYGKTEQGFMWAELNSTEEISIVGYAGEATELVIPSTINGISVTSIGSSAFRNCTSLTSVTIGNGVTSIENDIFNGCTALTEINFNATAMNDLRNSNGVFLNAGLSGEGIRVTIGKNVTKIPACLFYSGWNNYSFPKITSVVFEEGSVCESIGVNAFYNCTALTSITIPTSVTSIGSYVFSGCTGLESVTIPGSVTSIGSSAFNGCTSLTSITIPDSVTTIENWAFSGCNDLIIYTALTSRPSGWSSNMGTSRIVFDCKNYGKTEQGFMWAELNSTGEMSIIGYTGEDTELVIPSTINGISVTSIGSSAFRNCTSLTSITIPDSVTSIGSYAFDGCPINEATIPAIAISAIPKNSLEKVTINGGESIGSGAFRNCTSLTSIAIPDSVTSIESSAFEGCTSLTSVAIPDSVTSIGFWTFRNCTSLTSIAIPDSVTSIEIAAFSGCTGLESVTIPTSVTSIGSYAFSGCNKLTIYTALTSKPSGWERDMGANRIVFDCKNYGKTEQGFMWAELNSTGEMSIIGYTGEDIELVIPSTINGISVTSIGGSAFNGCTSLTSVTIPNSVTSIGSSAFHNCYKLVEVYNLSSLDITIASSDNGGVGYYAKVIHSSLDEPSILETVDDYIFMTWVGEYYLMGYVGDDTELTLPENYKGNNYEIYQYAFYECDDITKVTIPDSVASIGSHAFYYCTSLTSITIPDSVTSIGSYAFNGCTSLTIYCEAESKPSGWANSWNNFDCPVVWSYCPHTTTTILPAVEATCISTGLTEGRKCTKCDETLVEQEIIPINSNNHLNIQTIPGFDATCTETGLTDGEKCADCRETITKPAIIPAKGHTEQIIPAVEATCTETGLTEGKKCSACGEIAVAQQKTPAKGHTEQKIPAVEATCAETGLTEGKKCSVCGEITVAQQKTPTKEHTEQKIPAVEATCAETGLTEGKRCSVCGEILVKQEIIPINSDNHTSIKTLPYCKATCTETGLTEGKKCTACGKILVAQNEIDSLGHIYEGSYQCSRCDHSYATPSQNLEYELSQDGTYYTVVELGSCKDTSIVIPYTYEGLPVKAIGEYAFYGYSAIEGIIIPSSVETIGDYAFYGCSSLTIYCEAEGKPSGWSSSWNMSKCPVYWYSEAEPGTSDNYWYVNKEGNITLW